MLTQKVEILEIENKKTRKKGETKRFGFEENHVGKYFILLVIRSEEWLEQVR